MDYEQDKQLIADTLTLWAAGELSISQIADKMNVSQADVWRWIINYYSFVVPGVNTITIKLPSRANDFFIV